MKTKDIVTSVFSIAIKVIVLIVAAMFIYRYATAAYDYGYRVFGEKPMTEGEGRTVSVTIGSGMGTKEIGEALYITQNDFITAKDGTIATLAEQKDKFQKKYEEMIEAVRTGAADISQADVEEARKLYERSLQEYNAYARTHVEETKKSLEERIKIATANYKQLVQRYKSGDKSVTQEMIANAKYTMETLQAEYNAMPAAAEKTGTNISKGLAKGMTADEATNRIKGAVQTVFNKINTLFNGMFQIKSPSRVMRKTGVFIGQGLALGIEDTAATVEKSSNKLSDIVKGSFSAGTFDFGRIKNTYASIGKLRSSGIAETQSRINNISNSTSKNINGGVNVTINQAKLDTDADVERMGEKLADIIIRKGMEWG